MKTFIITAAQENSLGASVTVCLFGRRDFMENKSANCRQELEDLPKDKMSGLSHLH